MIIIRLQGGLGNQLFQYAFGRSFELRNKSDVRYDFEYFSFDNKDHDITLWPYELSKFNLEVQKALGLKGLVFKRIGKIPQLGFNINESKVESISLEKINGVKNGYFDGYWQSLKFFKEFEFEIRDEIRSGYIFNKENKKVLSFISQNESCSIHIRRGDFLNASVGGFNQDSLEYYRHAIGHLEERVKNINFFVFSDDLKWAESNLVFCKSPIHFIGINKGEDSHQDMMLMSNCDHNILANSTFSWWATFLNENTNKIVIAPNRWPKGSSKDIKCSNWKIIG